MLNIFTTWVVAWFVLFILKVTTITPKLILIIACFYNVLYQASVEGYCYQLFKSNTYTTEQRKRKNRKILKSYCIFILSKVIPLAIVWNTSISVVSAFASVLYFICFLLWLKFQGTSMSFVYGNLMNKFRV